MGILNGGSISDVVMRCNTGQKVLVILCVAAVGVLIWTIHLHTREDTTGNPPLWSAAYKEKVASAPTFLRRRDSCTESNPCVFKIIADLDQSSKHEPEDGGLLFRSVMLEGVLYHDILRDIYAVNWKSPVDVWGKHNEAGRGMELSELLLTSAGKLLSVDDRTGIIYEHISPDGKELVVPRHVVTEGSGETNKGMKIEWATEKDGDIWLGSFGKEYTGVDGQIINGNNFWVASLSPSGVFKRYDWTFVYNKIRDVLGVPWPGYVIHEAVNWSPVHRLWVFLPRRVSAEAYDDVKDEKRGSNKAVLADENFENFEVRELGSVTPERGFSSFKFVPGSRDSAILALKSEEEAATNSQRTFIMAYTLDGRTVMDETEVPAKYKFEGLEFIGHHN